MKLRPDVKLRWILSTKSAKLDAESETNEKSGVVREQKPENGVTGIDLNNSVSRVLPGNELVRELIPLPVLEVAIQTLCLAQTS